MVDTLEVKRTSVDLWGGMIQSALDYVGGEGRGDEGLQRLESYRDLLNDCLLG